MQVTFKRTAFIDGTRYRPGVQSYFGDIDKLPSDALVDGKPIEGRAKKEEASASSPAPIDEAALREKIKAELSTDKAFRESLKEELRVETTAEAAKVPPAEKPKATEAAGLFPKNDEAKK